MATIEQLRSMNNSMQNDINKYNAAIRDSNSLIQNLNTVISNYKTAKENQAKYFVLAGKTYQEKEMQSQIDSINALNTKIKNTYIPAMKTAIKTLTSAINQNNTEINNIIRRQNEAKTQSKTTTTTKTSSSSKSTPKNSKSILIEKSRLLKR